MNLHLAEIAKDVAPGRHAILLLDQAGWHTSDKLEIPPNITLLPLPAKCPELNPVENVWETVCSLPTRRSLAQASRGGWPEARPPAASRRTGYG
jgi:transposase